MDEGNSLGLYAPMAVAAASALIVCPTWLIRIFQLKLVQHTDRVRAVEGLYRQRLLRPILFPDVHRSIP